MSDDWPSWRFVLTALTGAFLGVACVSFLWWWISL